MEHRNLTGADLHEPKGVAGASNGAVYIADGAGSGKWTSVPIGSYYLAQPMSDGTSSGSKTFFVSQAPGKLTRLSGVFSSVPPGNVTVTVYKNGAAQGSPWVLSSSTSAAFQTLNVDVVQGDVILLLVTNTAGSGPAFYVTARFSIV